ncbi:MAG: ABC transporter permease [Treponema sp.]|nr:ABC transporter permease [Treponema sp.]
MSSERFLYILSLLPVATFDTMHMTFTSAFFACVLGFPLGVYLYVASPAGLVPQRMVYSLVSQLVNLFRSIPFIILMVLLIPMTRMIVGTSIGPTAAIVSLSIAAAPFFARITEAAMSEVDIGVITAAKAMGSTHLQIIRKVLIPEAMPALVSGLALTIINLIAYSAMAGAMGSGGLGDLAISYGYHRFQTDVTIGAVIVILILVQVVQVSGTVISRRLLSKR